MKRDIFNAVFDMGDGNSQSVYAIWQTFEGERKNISQIDHQHLSNIYYWMNLTFP